MNFQKTVLKNGVRVVTENHPDSVGVSCGLWVDKGTRDEPKNFGGISHFLEHLVFKGTKSRTAYQIAKSLESVGGDLNAYTTRESTCFHTLSLRQDLKLSLEILSDLVLNAQFSNKDFEREKQVVMQEILMATDNLEDYIYDYFFERFYGGHPLARPILGTAASLAPLNLRSVMNYYAGTYRSPNLLISCVGHLDHREVVAMVERLFKKTTWRPAPRFVPRTTGKSRMFREVVTKPAEQVHILLGLPSSSFSSSYRFESFVFNTLLGGGMTSRLYQSVRERRGLVYSVFSQIHTFTDTGICLVYAASEPKNVKSVLKLTMAELEKIRRNGITQRDLNMFRKQVRGNILLGADDVENRMNSVAVNDMVFGEYRSVDKVLEEINQVSVESVNEYIRKYVDPTKISAVLMGGISQVDGHKVLKDTLA
jgi:predicted Zn-dependent peptidase